MADTYRYRYGDANPAILPWKTAIAVQVGDLVYQDSADGYTVKPAAVIAYDGSFSQTQIDFVKSFVGVSAQRYDGVTAGIGVKDGFLRIDTTGVFEFATAANTTLQVGQLVGPDNAGSGTLLSQQVVLVSAKANAIGRVERGITLGSSVFVRIFTTIVGVINN